MHYVEIVTLASNAQMLSLNSDTCQVSDTLTSVRVGRGHAHPQTQGPLLFLLQSLPQSRSFHLNESNLLTLHFRDCAFSFNLRMLCFAIRLEDFSFFARHFIVLHFTLISMRPKLIFVQVWDSDLDYHHYYYYWSMDVQLLQCDLWERSSLHHY